MNDGRVAVITGAGNGIGRAHALAFAADGAKVVVNDLGGSGDGHGADSAPARSVVEAVRAAGGDAVANFDDVSSFDGAQALIKQAIDTFGRLDILVNNAGILRDRMVVTMSEDDWDDVIRVHLKGTFAASHHAAAYWREQSKAGRQPVARIINTSSASGLFGNAGQTNYGAAKAGIAMFSVIAAIELARYGVTVNCIAPSALTRLTERVMSASVASDAHDPSRISPLAVWLGSPLSGDVTGRVFSVAGNRITVEEPWVNGPFVEQDEVWLPQQLTEVVPDLVKKARGNSDMLGNTVSERASSATSRPPR